MPGVARFSLVGLAGAAGGAACAGGLVDRHLLQVVGGHEADEDAVLLVVPEYAGDHGDLLRAAALRLAGTGGLGRGACLLGVGGPVSADGLVGVVSFARA